MGADAGRRAFILLLAFWTAASPLAMPPPATSAAGLADIEIPGSGRVQVSGWGGADITLWYLRPPGAPADAPVVFVMHGVRRDADRCLSEWQGIAMDHGVVVAVPEFSPERFPGARSYNFGNLFAEDGTLRARASWSYSALEPLFDALIEAEGLSTTRYWLFGYSAGAQFVHRHVMLGAGPRLLAAIAASAGSYLFPVDDVDWPFGLRGAPMGDEWNPFGSSLVLMLGDEDIDSGHSSLPRQPAALRQGSHRLQRGMNFYEAARSAARQRGVAFPWSCIVVPGVAHDNAGMSRAAIEVIVGSIRPEPGADCAASPVPDGP